jgi:hypothetical protein
MTLENYFYGKDIIDFYNGMIEKFPEQKRKFNLEKFYYAGMGRVLTNALSFGGVAGIVGGLVANDLVYFLSGVVCLSSGERMKPEMKKRYEKKKEDYILEKIEGFGKLVA